MSGHKDTSQLIKLLFSVCSELAESTHEGYVFFDRVAGKKV